MAGPGLGSVNTEIITPEHRRRIRRPYWIMLACIPLVYWVFSSLGMNVTPTVVTRRAHTLVTRGPYRWVRHPLYTCALILIWLASPMTWNILALNLGISAYLWIGSIFEERKLVQQFGQMYKDYRKHTPRIIPGIHT